MSFANSLDPDQDPKYQTKSGSKLFHTMIIGMPKRFIYRVNFEKKSAEDKHAWKKTRMQKVNP